MTHKLKRRNSQRNFILSLSSQRGHSDKIKERLIAPERYTEKSFKRK
jgi:hypothetical protein